MTENPILKKEAIQMLESFRRKFYEKFGLDIDISTKDPDWDFIVANTDTNLSIILNCLNAQIPPEMKIIYPNIFCKARKRELVDLRMIFMLLARRKGLTLHKIGEICDKDHSTVLYAIKNANNLVKNNPEFERLYQRVLKNVEYQYQLHYARVNQPVIAKQDYTQSAPVTTLYPRENTSGYTAAFAGR